MLMVSEILTDEAVHNAAQRLREALKRNLIVANDQDRADMDVIFAWIARQTELPAAYDRQTNGQPHAKSNT